jgi:hypothetical protein
MEHAPTRLSRRRTRESREARLILPDGRWSIPGTWLWRERTGRFARVELAEVIYRARWAA